MANSSEPGANPGDSKQGRDCLTREGDTMDKKTTLKYGGIAAVVIGTGALYLSGTGESAVIEIVAGVFVVIGVIADIIRDKFDS